MYHETRTASCHPLHPSEVLISQCLNVFHLNHPSACATIEAEQKPLLQIATHLLNSLGSQHKRVLFLHTNAVFDTDAHASEMRRVIVGVGNVDATIRSASPNAKPLLTREKRLRLDSDALAGLQKRFPGLTGGIMYVKSDVMAYVMREQRVQSLRNVPT